MKYYSHGDFVLFFKVHEMGPNGKAKTLSLMKEFLCNTGIQVVCRHQNLM